MSKALEFAEQIQAELLKICPEPTREDLADVVIALVRNAACIVAINCGKREYDHDLLISATESAVKSLFAEIRSWPSRN